MPPVRSRDDLTSLLATKITTGEFQPGELLPSERSLAEEYGLSRSMVREALRALAERRLIDVQPGRGSRVRMATVADAVERLKEIFDHTQVTPRFLIEARTMIETTGAALAAERASEQERDAIQTAASKSLYSQPLVERVRWDLAFHLSIIQAAKNPLVEIMFQAIRPYIVEQLFRSLTDPEVTERGLVFHHRISEAIGRRDPEAASQAMSGHLILGISLFGQDLDRNLSVVAHDALARLSSADVTFEELIALTRDQAHR